jgi:hypothetical protein
LFVCAVALIDAFLGVASARTRPISAALTVRGCSNLWMCFAICFLCGLHSVVETFFFLASYFSVLRACVGQGGKSGD